jgi:hypothetical protein
MKKKVHKQNMPEKTKLFFVIFCRQKFREGAKNFSLCTCLLITENIVITQN